MALAKISVRNVNKIYGAGSGAFKALDDVNLEVTTGEFLCVVGPSGCGKSTLLRMLGGLDFPTDGEVSVRQEDPARPQNAMIFQQESVFPWLTVERNAAYGLEVTNTWKGAESRERIEYFLERTGLLGFKSFYPHQLSGGMKQRLSVARAFVTNPEILLMDEPFAALDEQNKMLLQQELEKLWEESRNTVVFITHSLEEAVLLGDRVVVMSSAPGHLTRTFEVPFDRPRDLIALRRSPEFNRLIQEIWEVLREEVDRARSQEAKKMRQSGGHANG